MNNWLYTYTLEGKCYDADRTEYEMVLVSRWSDRTKKAKVIERKCFYFMGTEQQIEKLLKTEMEVRNLFYNTNYAKFGIIEKLEAKRIYE